MTDDLPVLPVRGRVLDAHLHLLDRQVQDRDDVPVGYVNDLVLDVPADGSAPTIRDLVPTSGLLTRLFGGRPPASRLLRIPWSDVAEIKTAVTLGVRGSTLDVTWTERWVRDHVIGRIPGGRHDPE